MWSIKSTSFEPGRVELLEPDISGGLQPPGDGIARGIRIAGDIKGRNDLTIAGEVTGSIFLPQNAVLVRATAEVHANITARTIEVEGTVTGDLVAAERVIIRRASVVEGDVVSPQIQLEEGCRFKGSVQMSEPNVKHKPSSKPRMVDEPATVRMKAVAG